MPCDLVQQAATSKTIVVCAPLPEVLVETPDSRVRRIQEVVVQGALRKLVH